MFTNTIKYQDTDFGRIKNSKSNTPLVFNGETSGIAIKYAIAGKEIYTVNNKQIPLYKGQFVILKTNVAYRVSASNTYTEGLCLDISSKLFDDTIEDVLENNLLFNMPFSGVLSTQLGNALSTFSGQDFDYNPIHIISSLKDELLDFQKDLVLLKNALATSTKKTETQKHLIAKLLKTREYIHYHFSHKITLDALATTAGLSKYHLSRIFKECFNISPQKMQEQLRMEKAKKLVLKNTISLTDITYQLGYTDLAAFSKTFNNHHHFPPSQYLKNIK